MFGQFRAGTVHKQIMLPSTFCFLSGFQSPMVKAWLTMRVPGFSSARRLGRSLAFRLSRRYSVTTVALLNSAANKSSLRKVTRSVTPAFRAFASADRKGRFEGKSVYVRVALG